MEGNAGPGEGRVSSPQEDSSEGYDAAIVAPNVTRDVLSVLAELIYGGRTYCDGQRVTYTIRSRDPDETAGEIRICLNEASRRGPEITVDGTPALGSGIKMSVRGPVDEWALAQRVDDHQLLTELLYHSEPVLSVYGPPAKPTPHSGIAISGDGGHELLVAEEHRR